jgi:hypothetical protein
MEALTTKELFEKLHSDNLKAPSALLGIIKKSDKQSELLFTFKHDSSNWVRIPQSMIESAYVLKDIPGNEDKLTLVKLQLKTPSDGEAKVLFDLLSVLSAKMNKFHKMRWMKKMMMMGGVSCGDSSSMHDCGHEKSSGMKHDCDHDMHMEKAAACQMH